MEFGVPVQIVRESTLRVGPPQAGANRGLTPESDRAWNLGNTLYYKAGGKPWRLTTETSMPWDNAPPEYPTVRSAPAASRLMISK